MFPLQDEVRFPDSFEDQKYSWLGWKFWRQFLQRNIPYLQFPQDEECHWLWHSKRRFPELVMPKFIHFSWNGSSRNMRPASARPNGRSSSPSRVRRPTSGGWTRTMTPFTTGFESPINPNNEIKPGMHQTRNGSNLSQIWKNNSNDKNKCDFALFCWTLRDNC